MENLRILIIDDNPDIHHDFIKILTTNAPHKEEFKNLSEQLFGQSFDEETKLPQFQIDTALQGLEGINRIEQALREGKPYSLAFVDIRMPPGLDGIETVKRIWKLDPDIQIVICTAYSDYTWEQTIEHLGQRENFLILKKPFDSIAVRQLSCALTKKWQLSQETRAYTKLLEERVEERTSSLQRSLSITRGTLESAADGIIVISKTDEVIDYNQLFVDMWQIPEALLAQKKAHLIFEFIVEQLDTPKSFLEKLNTLFKADDLETDKLKCHDGRVIESYTQPYKLEEATAGRIWSFRDITKRARLEDRVQYQATHDTLTELPNRALLTDRINQAISKSKRHHLHFGIIFFDLDRFKLINDSFSHSSGDELLKGVAARLSKLMREEDTLARLGGDEFVVVTAPIKDEGNVAYIAEKLLNGFRQPFEILDHEIMVTPSIGIGMYPRDGEDVDELLRSADAAMYHAKELGGNQFQFYTLELSQQSLVRLEMEADLYRAIENNEFFVNYQPQFDLTSYKLVSAEALIRWQHPQKGIILPIEFIPLAEETGLITAIGEMVLRTACKQNKAWQDAGLPHIRVAVNVTTQQLKQPNFIDIVKDILKETGLNPKYLELELTENVIINNLEATQCIIKLNEMGIYIALDDFGTGYSSINYLRKIPLDRLKIDQSFIKNININRGDEVIIKAIIAMAKNLDLEILAEGVETQSQLDFLKSRNCGEVQGFYFSQPLSAFDLEELLRQPTDSVSKLIAKKTIKVQSE